MDKRVFVHRNEAGSEGKVVCIEQKDSLTKFKRAASRKLGMKVRQNPHRWAHNIIEWSCLIFVKHRTASKANISRNWRRNHAGFRAPER
jgi:hypothetical protein